MKARCLAATKGRGEDPKEDLMPSRRNGCVPRQNQACPSSSEGSKSRRHGRWCRTQIFCLPRSLGGMPERIEVIASLASRCERGVRLPPDLLSPCALAPCSARLRARVELTQHVPRGSVMAPRAMDLLRLRCRAVDWCQTAHAICESNLPSFAVLQDGVCQCSDATDSCGGFCDWRIEHEKHLGCSCQRKPSSLLHA